MDRTYYRIDADNDADRIERRTAALVAAAELSGRHVWAVLTAFACPDPEAGAAVLSPDNMLSFPQVGCFRCERPYERRLLLRRCPGEPK